MGLFPRTQVVFIFAILLRLLCRVLSFPFLLYYDLACCISGMLQLDWADSQLTVLQTFR